MLQSLRGVEGGEAALPFVSLFYSSSSTHSGMTMPASPTTLSKEKGGEQGDPLMPLFAKGQ